MRTTARTVLAALAFALPTLAQTVAVAKPAGDTTTLWRIEATGISG